MKAGPLICSLACALTLVGCKTEVTTFTMFSRQKLDPSKHQFAPDRSTTVSGRDDSTLILIFSTHFPDVETAVDKACAKKPGCVGLSNVTVRREWFWLLFGYNNLVVEGNPIYKKGEH